MIFDCKIRNFSNFSKINSLADFSLNDVIDYYDFTFIYKGSFTYIINGKTIVLNEGDGLFLSPGTHRIRLNTTDSTRKYASINFFGKNPFDFPQYSRKSLTHEVKNLLKIFNETYFGFSEFREEQLSAILYLLILELQKNFNNMDRNQNVVAIIDYIHSHISEKITLEDIGKNVSLAPTYCSSIIKKELGISAFQYIIQERMNLAKLYILSGDMSLQEISTACGYTDYSFFSKHFKRHFGISPHSYKKKT